MRVRNPLFILFELLGSLFVLIGHHIQSIMCFILLTMAQFLIVVIPLHPLVATLAVCSGYIVGGSFFQWRYSKFPVDSWKFDDGLLLLISSVITIVSSWAFTLLALFLLV